MTRRPIRSNIITNSPLMLLTTFGLGRKVKILPARSAKSLGERSDDELELRNDESGANSRNLSSSLGFVPGEVQQLSQPRCVVGVRSLDLGEERSAKNTGEDGEKQNVAVQPDGF